MIDWKPLRRELAIWRSEGRSLPLWWRDDDATRPTSALDNLLLLCDKLDLAVNLAVIPETAEAALGTLLVERAKTCVLVHGWAHQNHAPPNVKKAEFGHPRDGRAREVQAGLERLSGLFGATLVPVFVPPWNRIEPEFIPTLAASGYQALSTYGPRATRFARPGLVQINTHIDPIHWRGGGGLVPPETLITDIVANLRARRAGQTDATEPLGFLTHHLVHDDAIWAFTEAFLSEMLDGGARAFNLLEQMGNLP